MADRAVHLVGSFPAESTEEAMRAMLDGVGGRLRTLPTGEVRRHEFYILPIIEDLVNQGVLEAKRPVLPGAGHRTVHRLTRDGEPVGGPMDLGYLRETQESLPIFGALAPASERARPVLQIGMPTDFTLGFIAMGLSGARSHRRIFTEADEQTRTLHMIERALGRAVDAVASPCGLGRDSRELAEAHMARARVLAAAE